MKNVIHQIDRNEWLLLSAFQQGLRQNLSWFLSYTGKRFFFYRFHFKVTRKSIASSTKFLGICKIALRLRDRHVFMWRSLEIFYISNFEQIFWKTQTLFKKLERRFLVESAKIENATFSYKTPLSEANVKTNRVGSTKWTYHTGRSFASNYFIFLEILF